MSWTAWHTAGFVITLVDLGLGTSLFILHYAIATILYLLGGIQALGLSATAALYQLTMKKGS